MLKSDGNKCVMAYQNSTFNYGTKSLAKWIKILLILFLARHIKGPGFKKCDSNRPDISPGPSRKISGALESRQMARLRLPRIA